jgi:hypothetical protein
VSRSYTKLFSSICESTVWAEPLATRVAWITMLAMADRQGRVWASVPGLANRARITIEQTETALARFMAPDRYSRTPDNEGRRIEPIDGGWRLLNHEKYRDMHDEEARRDYSREWDRQHRPTRTRQNPTKPDTSDNSRAIPTQAAPAPTPVKSNPLPPSGAFIRFWTAWPKNERKQAKGKCWEVWRKAGLNEHEQVILAHVAGLKLSDGWRRGFVPGPLVYLNGRRWEGADDAPQHAELRLAI